MGYPLNGVQIAKFTSNFFVALCKHLGIAQHMTSAYHPQTNGACERLNQTLIQILRCLEMDTPGIPWTFALSYAEMKYPHKATGHSPFYIVYGAHPVFHFELPKNNVVAPCIIS